MPLDASVAGSCLGSIVRICDARWLMSYSSGVPDERPELYDTVNGLVIHPLFPVSPEWELLISLGSTPPTMTPSEVIRGVHVAHDVIIERSLRPGETVTISATVIAVDRRHSGAVQSIYFETTDVAGRVVWRTVHVTVFRDVELVGHPFSVDIGWPALPTRLSSDVGTVSGERTSWVRSIDAHVYTECARIWNPIHTDVARARGAGLDEPILQGTATLARAVSIVTEMAGVSLAQVHRVAGSFSAMVSLGSRIRVRLLEMSGSTLHFEVLNDGGQRAVRGGVVSF